jgi:hypothetical protein
MRLRTACSFEREDTGSIESKNVKGFNLPTREELVGPKDGNGKWQGPLPTLIAKLAGKDGEKMRVTPVTFKG